MLPDVTQIRLTDTLLQQIAAEHGTPLYVYDLDSVRARLQQLREALPEASIRYAVKANPSAAVLRTLAQAGAGAEVITEGELVRALEAGISAADVLVGGPAQGAELRQRALTAGVGAVSLDSESQWDDWQPELEQAVGPAPAFLVRVNPALDPRTHQHLATGSADSKFGLLPEAAARLASRLSDSGHFAGFHVHAGSQIGDLGVFRGVLDVLDPLCREFPGTLLDLGGGYRVPDFPLSGYAELVRPFAAHHGLQLIIEPGRWLVAEAGVLLSTVLHVKPGDVTHVIADAGMADLLRPALYGAEHPVRIAGAPADRSELTVDVDGPLCENADRLARQVVLPEPRRGDLLVIGEAGAYGLGMASNYASSLRPAEVAVESGSHRLVRRREEPADLLRSEL